MGSTTSPSSTMVEGSRAAFSRSSLSHDSSKPSPTLSTKLGVGDFGNVLSARLERVRVGSHRHKLKTSTCSPPMFSTQSATMLVVTTTEIGSDSIDSDEA